MSAALEAWQAGFVRRWHANPDMSHVHDEIAAHQGRCLVLAIQLFPDASADLLRAIAMHDLAERWVGDLPYPFKSGDFAGAATAHRDAERAVAQGMGFSVELSAKDTVRLDLVDRLDAYLLMMRVNPALRCRDDWRHQPGKILRAAAGVGLDLAVGALMDAAEGQYCDERVSMSGAIRAYFSKIRGGWRYGA